MDTKKIQEIIKEFNRLFNAECEISYVENDEIKVLFKGHVCFTCGAYDYFEDLAIMLSEKLNKEYGIEEYKQLKGGKYLISYKPKNKISSVKRDVKIFVFK